MSIMGLDYGAKTVGVAISDTLLFIARPHETIFRKREDKLRKTLARIEAIIEEYEVTQIVLGLPLNMDDSLGERAKKTLEFKEILEKRLGREIILQDERLSTFEAQEVLRQANVRKEDMKAYVDKIAASYILQDYLDGRNKQDNPS